SNSPNSSPSKSTLDANLLNFPPRRERFFVAMVPLQEAVEACQRLAVSPDTDGQVLSSFVLTETDHWGNNYEKLVFLTERSVVLSKFDFVTRRHRHSRRLLFSDLTKVALGDLTLPARSLAPMRCHGALRLFWGEPSRVGVGQTWNPFSSVAIPYTTLAHHPLHYCEPEAKNPVYDLDCFASSLIGTLADRAPQVQVVSEPLPLNLYHGISSTVFNQSWLGYSKDRNGASF
ncbi:hypothetical protein BOX15_Mlig007686g1, partial [Macrostomum lignano]